MRWLSHLIVLTLVMAAGTWFAGWWFVPIAGGVYGAWETEERASVITAMLASAFAWIGLLVFDAFSGPMARLTEVLGGVLHFSGSTLVVLAIAYAALLGACAAAFARGVRRLASPV